MGLPRGSDDLPRRPCLVDPSLPVHRPNRRYLTLAQISVQKSIRTEIDAAIKGMVNAAGIGVKYTPRVLIQYLYVLRWWYSTALAYMCTPDGVDDVVLQYVRALKGATGVEAYYWTMVGRAHSGKFHGHPDDFGDWFRSQAFIQPFVDRISVRWSTGAPMYGPYLIIEKRRLGRKWSRIW